MSRSLYISCSIAIWLVTCLACMAMLTNWAAAAEPVDFEPLLHRQPAVSFAAAEFRNVATSAPPLSFAALLHRQDARESSAPAVNQNARSVNQPAAQLVLPAAIRPPAAVPATTAPAGVFCTGGQCYFRPPKTRSRKGR
jgi:hypothetical protein